MSVKAKARQVYAELVRGRSRVRVVPAVEPNASEPPVFLVGAYRSGTTLVRFLMDSHPRIACPPETIIMNYLDPLASAPRSLERLEGLGFDRDHVLSATRRYVSYFYESYAASCGKPRWADKSPENVWHLEFLADLFPDAQFVLIVRHVLDQVHSHVMTPHDLKSRLADYGLSEGDDIRVCAARYWRAAVRAQLTFRAAHPDACHLLRYEDLCAAPEARTREILDFLGERWDASVLEYYKKDHDFGKSDNKAKLSRGIALSTGGYGQWDRDVVERIQSIAAAELDQLGMPMTPSAVLV
ncbi:MAG TPA: sulfotransferase [Marmoricola sp.]